LTNYFHPKKKNWPSAKKKPNGKKRKGRPPPLRLKKMEGAKHLKSRQERGENLCSLPEMKRKPLAEAKTCSNHVTTSTKTGNAEDQSTL